eukprot:NODE_4682_length_776_cov_28.685007_g4338_i0.p1 GENE.NODE_4682_length_776_cov_28.685007_g4338_i0~~NODE_4682_length_776_cov_28.685007_g4338_i0.p1  ORF type:complete len:189 (+),score=32.44 NODE_4682_length_776_cov_28.685007_g4338_i0:53-619(+)
MHSLASFFGRAGGVGAGRSLQRLQAAAVRFTTTTTTETSATDSKTTTIESRYPVRYTQELAWSDMDGFGHMNNARYLTYFENARIKYLQEMDKSVLDNKSPVNIVIGEVQCHFKSAVSWPGSVTTQIGVTEIGESYFVNRYRMICDATGKVASEGWARVVTVNSDNGRKTKVPERVIEGIHKLETPFL